MRVLTVVGARPQFVKAAPVSRAIRGRHEEILVHTGQHSGEAMSDAFFRDLAIPAPDVSLGCGDVPSGERMAAMVRGIARVVRERRPDAVLVYGDTDSTFAGALAARESRVPLVHVEAGLRSGDLTMPEEVHRIAVDHLSDVLLAPTPSSAARLRSERAAGRVEVVGDVMLDACLEHAPAARRLGVPAALGLVPGGYHVATIHRPATVDVPVRLAAVVAALDTLDRPVVLPCHPRTSRALDSAGVRPPFRNLRRVEPLPYLRMLGLLAGACTVLTDSGGVQREAFFLGVPCVTLRDVTEWGETVEAGWNRLAGTNPERIRAAVRDARRPATPPDLAAWGGGHAAEAVRDALRP